MITIRGIPLKIVDTAGIRKTKDKIEEIGVEKAIKVAKDADLILAIFDNTKDLSEEDLKIIGLLKDKKAIILLNKIDVIDKKLENVEELKNTGKKIIKISAKNRNGIDELYEEIERMFNIKELDLDSGNVITNIRHKNQIAKAMENLENAINSIQLNLPIDIISINIRQILDDLGKITGENVTEDIINEIFSKFCLGK